MAWEPNDLFNVYGQLDQDALRAIAEQAAQSGGAWMGGGSYYQSPQGSCFIPDIADPPDMSYHFLGGGAYTDYNSLGVGTIPSGDTYELYWGSSGFGDAEYRESSDEYPERFTVQATGLYIVGAHIRWVDGAAPSPFNHVLRVSGDFSPILVELFETSSYSGGSVAETRQMCVFASRINAGGYVQVSAYQDSGSDQLLSISHCHFWIARMTIGTSPNFPATIDGGES